MGKSNIRVGVGCTCERAGDDQQGLRELGNGQLLAQDKDKGKERNKGVGKVTNKYHAYWIVYICRWQVDRMLERENPVLHQVSPILVQVSHVKSMVCYLFSAAHAGGESVEIDGQRGLHGPAPRHQRVRLDHTYRQQR